MDIEIKRGYCYTIFWKEDSLFRRGVESVICFRCGKSVPEGGVCPYCGQDLSAASPAATEAAPADSQASVPPAPLPEKKRRSVAGPLAVGAAAVLARGVPGSWRKKVGRRLAVGALADALRRVRFVFRGGSAGPQAAAYGPQRGALVLAGSGDLGAAVRLYGCRAVPGRRKFPPDEPGFCLSVSAGRAWRGGPRKGAAMPREGQRHDHIVGGRH